MSSKVESSLPIPNELTLLPNADLRGIVSPTAARLREAILAATDFIKAPHPSDSSEYVQECKDFGALVGPCGISYAFLRLVEQAPYIGLDASAASFRDSAIKHIDVALAGPYMTAFPASTPRNCGEIGYYLHPTGTLVQALCCHFAGVRPLDDETLARLTRQLCEQIEPAFWVNPVVDGSAEDIGMDSEPVNGRTGFLQGVLILRRYIKGSTVRPSPQLEALISFPNLSEMVAAIIQSGQAGAKRLARICAATPALEDRPLSPLMWAWNANEDISKLFHIGAGHGVVGILSIVLQCPASTYAPFHDLMLSTIDFLVSIQTATGDLPRTYPEWDRYTVYWCHGAGGFVQFLSVLLQLDHKGSLPLGEERKQRVMIALDKSADAVWSRGLLRKGPGICHGIGGNAYVLLAASLAAPSLPVATASRYRAQAVTMGVFATDWQDLVARGEIRLPDTPKSLLEGIAGTACAWADMLATFGEGKVLGYPGMGDSGEV